MTLSNADCGFNPVDAMRFALEHQNPLVAETLHRSSILPEKAHSFLDISAPETLAWAFKAAEDGIDQGIVLRMWNLASPKN